MKVILENIYFNVLDDTVDEYNNTYHTTIKMKPIDVKSDSYAIYNEQSNEKDPKLNVGNHVRISKYTNIFAKGYAPNWSEEVFAISKTKNTVPWAYVINDLNDEEIIGSFYEKELQKTNQEFRIEKVIKRKGNMLYVKWKGYDNSFNSWIDKKDSIKMSQYFPPHRSFGGNINVKVDLPKYATKTDLKETGIDTSNFALKSNLASLKLKWIK